MIKQMMYMGSVIGSAIVLALTTDSLAMHPGGGSGLGGDGIAPRTIAAADDDVSAVPLKHHGADHRGEEHGEEEDDPRDPRRGRRRRLRRQSVLFFGLDVGAFLRGCRTASPLPHRRTDLRSCGPRDAYRAGTPFGGLRATIPLVSQVLHHRLPLPRSCLEGHTDGTPRGAR
jgi:hypothetical protein